MHKTLSVIVEVDYLNCSYTMTAQDTVHINGTAFTAEPNTYTFATSSPMFVIYNYPDVTITSLQQFETLYIVSGKYLTLTDDRMGL